MKLNRSNGTTSAVGSRVTKPKARATPRRTAKTSLPRAARKPAATAPPSPPADAPPSPHAAAPLYTPHPACAPLYEA